MKVCPTNGIQPSFMEAGVEAMWTPRLIPEIGYCEPSCTFCGDICPTGALQKFTQEDKKNIFIGNAVIDRSKCIAWNRNETCLICDEFCSYNAIDWRFIEGSRKPVVNHKKCTGCGICETNCPIKPGSAIVVYSHGEQRKKYQK